MQSLTSINIRANMDGVTPSSAMSPMERSRNTVRDLASGMHPAVEHVALCASFSETSIYNPYGGTLNDPLEDGMKSI